MEFKKIDKDGFIRIWNSDFNDGHLDSHQQSFEDSPADEWQKLYTKHLNVMYEAVLNGEPIGYIFLSPKEDGSAHLGYGLYKEFRGKGFSVNMCKEFLSLMIPRLDKSIIKILATTLKENKASQIVLEKLGFKLLEAFDDEFSYKRFVARPEDLY